MKRTAIPKERRGPPRRGRVVDKEYLAWIRTLPCCIVTRARRFRGCCDQINTTAHHVRRFGSPKNDRVVIPLCPAHHFHASGDNSIERLGKEAFERLYGLDINGVILELQERYQQERAAA